MSKALFSTDSIPQANCIGRVVDVVSAVAAGITTPEALAEALGVSTRQGLYYRTAARSLKLVKGDGDQIVLSGRGRRLLAASADPYRQQRVLREAVLKNRVLRAAHLQLSSRQGKTPEGLVRWLVSVSELNSATASRRLSSIVNWLCYAGLAYEADGRLRAVPAA